MKNSGKIFFLFSLLHLSFFSQLFAQWTNGQAAVKIIGAGNYTSVGTVYGVGMAVDVTNQKLYVSDYCNHAVYRYSLSSGDIAASPSIEATFGTSGTSGTTSTTLKNPSGLGVDNTGRLFIFDGGNNRVVWINTANSASSGATFNGVLGQANYTSGSANRGGSAANNTFNATVSSPSSIFSCQTTTYAGYIAINSSNVMFVSDPGNNRVLRFDAPTTTSTAASVIGQTSTTATSSGTTRSTLNTPMGVALDGTRLYITDMNNNRVVSYTSATTLTTGTNNAASVYGATSWTAPGTGGVTATQFDLPINVAVDGTGRLYIADSNNGRVVYINSASTKDGSGGTAVSFNGVIGQATLTTSVGGSPSSSTFWAGVSGLAVNSTNKRLYASNSGYARTVQFNASSALPVDFVSFTANEVNEKIHLDWITTHEINNYGFYVEQSFDGHNFISIGFVKGNGTKNESTIYSFETAEHNNQVEYFRLKQVDEDGNYSYSNVISFEKNHQTSFELFPNPIASNELFYSVNGMNEDFHDFKMEIISTDGNIINDINLSTLSGYIDISHLSPGVYIVKISTPTEVLTDKLVRR